MFLLAPITLAVLAVIAAITMLGAALAALAQDDIKRVLAYSTVSQLAYMLAALAVGSRDAAVFHLLAHAAFKALLFLAAGAVIHARRNESDAARWVGCAGDAASRSSTMTLGLAALVGVPPLAGFFSKESVLGCGRGDGVRARRGPVVRLGRLARPRRRPDHRRGHRRVLPRGCGCGRSSAGRMPRRTRPHATPAAMRWPLVLLAVPTVALGVVGLRAEWLPTWLGPVLEPESLAPAPITAAAAVVLALRRGGSGCTPSGVSEPAQDPTLALPPLLRDSFATGFGLDAVVRPACSCVRCVRRLATSSASTTTWSTRPYAARVAMLSGWADGCG